MAIAKRNLLLSLITILTLLLLPTQIYAQETGEMSEQTFEGEIVELEEAECIGAPENALCFNVLIEVENEELGKQEIEINEVTTIYDFQVGDNIFIKQYGEGATANRVVTGPVRDGALIMVVGLFVLVTIIVGGKQGLGSLVGLALSVFILFGFTIPALLAGWDPVLAGFGGAILVLGVSIFLSHGFNSKSLLALVATSLGLVVIAILTAIFIELAMLTGFGDENSLFILSEFGGELNMKGVLFASIIVAGVGIMDDVTVSIVSAMQEIYKANPRVSRKYLYQSAMNVGKDHIASMVNTLFIAYAGASMPLVMLLSAKNVGFREIVNDEMFTEEIIRTFIGSIGLVIILPVTSYIAAHLITTPNKPQWLFKGLMEAPIGHRH